MQNLYWNLREGGIFSMEYLNDYITRENLESEPGVIDQEKVRALRINLYLAYIDGCVELGGYEFPNIAAEMIEDVMLEEFCSYTHMLEGRYQFPRQVDSESVD